MTPERAHALSWMALSVGRTLSVAEALRERGYIVFAPYKMVKRRRRRGRRERQSCNVPIISGYVFIGAERPLDLYWPDLLRQRDVHGVICHRGQPAILPFSVLDRIRRRSWHADFSLDAAARNQDVDRAGLFAPHLMSVGDSAEILSGPYEGQAVEIVDLGRRGNKNVVKFLIDIFGSEVEAETEVDNVQRFAPTSQRRDASFRSEAQAPGDRKAS